MCVLKDLIGDRPWFGAGYRGIRQDGYYGGTLGYFGAGRASCSDLVTVLQED